jgi:hypothetical protein
MQDFARWHTFNERTLVMLRRVNGAKAANTNIVAALTNLSFSYKEVGDFESALTYGRQGLAMVCDLHEEKGVYDEGVGVGRRGGAAQTERAKEEETNQEQEEEEKQKGHTALLAHLADVLKSLGDLKGAQDFRRQELALQKKIHGTNAAHTDILDALCRLGMSSYEGGDLVSANQQIQEALAMWPACTDIEASTRTQDMKIWEAFMVKIDHEMAESRQGSPSKKKNRKKGKKRAGGARASPLT